MSEVKAGDKTGRFCGGHPEDWKPSFGTLLRGIGNCGEPLIWTPWKGVLTDFCPRCKMLIISSDHPGYWKVDDETERQIYEFERAIAFSVFNMINRRPLFLFD